MSTDGLPAWATPGLIAEVAIDMRRRRMTRISANLGRAFDPTVPPLENELGDACDMIKAVVAKIPKVTTPPKRKRVVPLISHEERWVKHGGSIDRDRNLAEIYLRGLNAFAQALIEGERAAGRQEGEDAIIFGPVPELRGTIPMVLYFKTQDDADEFREVFQEAKPNARTRTLR